MGNQTSLGDVLSKFGDKAEKDEHAEHGNVFGKKIAIEVDTFSNVTVNGFRAEYLTKDGDVIIHFYAKRWPEDFVDRLEEQINSMGDQCYCDWVSEVDSWFVRVFDYSMRRMGAEADAAYISQLLSKF